MAASHGIRFGPFLLNRARGCLEDARGAELGLRAKSFRVLEALAARPDELVSKDDLIREAWPDVIVSDDSLAQCVSEIRRALGPEGRGLIRTVPRRGYMLVSGGADRGTPRAPGGSRDAARFAALPLALGMAALFVWGSPQRETAPVGPVAAHPEVAEAEALLESRDWRRREANEHARTLLETVVAEEPGHAAAWAGLGLTYWLEVRHLAWGGGRREMALAFEMVERSVSLGGSAEAHRLLAEMRLLAPFAEMRAPVDALASARAAVAIDPGDPDNLAVLAQVLALTGHPQEAVRMIEAARGLDPDPPDWYRQIAGLGHLMSGAPARAAEEFGPLHGAGTFDGTRWWPGWLFAASLAHAGRVNEAAALVDAARARRPGLSVAGVAQSFGGFADRAGLALVLDGLRRAGLPD
jgi:cytochrome c-type biogenesis protein CcmH/NrfG